MLSVLGHAPCELLGANLRDWVDPADVSLLLSLCRTTEPADAEHADPVRQQLGGVPGPRVRRGERGAIHICTSVDDGDVLITIADTGGGIPAEINDRVFDPFFTTKDVGKGTGQGLAIARTVIDRAGGELTFKTRPGDGTTFSVRLPLIAVVTMPVPA